MRLPKHLDRNNFNLINMMHPSTYMEKFFKIQKILNMDLFDE